MEKEKTETISEIRIYVACLASYNNGILHGRWIDATLGVEHIWEEIKKVFETSPIEGAEEHAIHDYEGFEDISLSEYTSVERVCEFAEFIEEHGALGAKLYAYLSDLDDAKDYLADNYQGEYRSLPDYAQELTEETTQIPESLQYYIDYEKMGRDLEINDVLAIEMSFDEIHIFWRA
jgi:antirestriction protein